MSYCLLNYSIFHATSLIVFLDYFFVCVCVRTYTTISEVVLNRNAWGIGIHKVDTKYLTICMQAGGWSVTAEFCLLWLKSFELKGWITTRLGTRGPIIVSIYMKIEYNIYSD